MAGVRGLPERCSRLTAEPGSCSCSLCGTRDPLVGEPVPVRSMSSSRRRMDACEARWIASVASSLWARGPNGALPGPSGSTSRAGNPREAMASCRTVAGSLRSGSRAVAPWWLAFGRHVPVAGGESGMASRRCARRGIGPVRACADVAAPEAAVAPGTLSCHMALAASSRRRRPRTVAPVQASVRRAAGVARTGRSNGAARGGASLVVNGIIAEGRRRLATCAGWCSWKLRERRESAPSARASGARQAPAIVTGMGRDRLRARSPQAIERGPGGRRQKRTRHAPQPKTRRRSQPWGRRAWRRRRGRSLTLRNAALAQARSPLGTRRHRRPARGGTRVWREGIPTLRVPGRGSPDCGENAGDCRRTARRAASRRACVGWRTCSATSPVASGSASPRKNPGECGSRSIVCEKSRARRCRRAAGDLRPGRMEP